MNKCCKGCGLEFNEDNKDKFNLYFNILKDGSKSYYYKKSKCKKCDMKRFIKSKSLIRELKENTPCKDCGIKYPYYVMHFDHKYDKKFHLARGSVYSKEEVLKEIEKCDIVCANCHAIRTFNRIKLN